MAAKICNEGFLCEIIPRFYHIFPVEEMLRELWVMETSKTLGAHDSTFKGLRPRNLMQQDGSRLKCLYNGDVSSKKLIYKNINDIQNVFNHRLHGSIHIHSVRTTSSEKFFNYLKNQQTLIGTIYLYHINNFTNGKRYFPIYISPDRSICINLTWIIKGRKPKDMFGVFISDEDSIEALLEDSNLQTIPFKLMRYTAEIRVCKECSNIYNMNKAVNSRKTKSFDKRRIIEVIPEHIDKHIPLSQRRG